MWKRGKLSEAVPEFRKSLIAGYQPPPVYHGLGHCLFRLGQVADAEKTIEEGFKRYPNARPDILLLDLAAQVAIARGKYKDAENYINQLKQFGEDLNYYHRLSVLHSAQRNFRSALIYAENACDSPGRRFEFLTNRVDILIELEEFERATNELTELDRLFRVGWDRIDVRLGLRCKLLLRQKQWRQAGSLWKDIEDKQTPVCWGLRVEILRQTIEDVNASPGERIEAREELERLEVSSPTGAILFALVDAADMLDSVE